MQTIKNSITQSIGQNWPLYLVILFSLMAHWPWLNVFGIFTSGDWWYVSPDKYFDYFHFSPIWVTDNLGGTSATPHYYAVRFFEALLSLIGLPFSIIEKIFYFIPVVLVAPIGAYFLCKPYSNKYIAAIGALFFCFNSIFIFNQVGPFTIAVAYSLIPLMLYFARSIVGSTEKKYIKMLYFATIFNIIILYELRIALLAAFISGLYFIYQLIFLKKTDLKTLLLTAAVVLFSVLIFQSFWIVPYLISAKSITFSDLLSRGLFVSYSNIMNALTLSHPFWTGARPATFEVQPITLTSWLIPVVSFIYLFLYTKDESENNRKDYFFWILLALIGIFLVKQANQPFEFVYAWLFDKIPGFSAFRESSKFYIFIILGYTVSIVISLNSLAHRYVNLKSKLYRQKFFHLSILLLPVFAILSVITVNSLPLLTTSFRTTLIPRTMPDEYIRLSSYLSKEEYSRTMWIPADSRWAYSTNQHPKVSINSISPGLWKQEVKQFSAADTLRDTVYNIFKDDELAKDLLINADVKYIIIPIRDTLNEDDFYRYYGNDRQYYVNLLDSKTYLEKIDFGYENLAVYKSKLNSSYVRIADNIQHITSNSNKKSMKKFIEHQLDQEFTYALLDGSSASYNKHSSATRVEDLFGNITDADIGPESISNSAKIDAGSTLYTNINNSEYRYNLNDNSLKIESIKKDFPYYNNRSLGYSSKNVGKDIVVDRNTKYYLDVDGDISALKSDNEYHNIGRPNDTLKVHSLQGAIDGLNISSSDCDTDSEEIVHTLKIEKDVNCFIRHFNVDSSNTEYLYLSFEYRLTGTDDAGIAFTFDNGNYEILHIKSFDKNWHTYNKIIEIPRGAKVLDIKFYGFPQYSLLNNSLTQYKSISLSKFPVVADLSNELEAEYKETEIDNSGSEVFYPVKSSKNIVGNPSFEDGLWREKVGDCNAYDNKPDIHMEQSNMASHGNKSLELRARMHIACTSKGHIPVDEGSTYMLSFDYQSDNSTEANYYVAFSGRNELNISEKIDIKNSNWEHYSKLIKIPLGVNKIDLVVYAKATDGRTNIINRYDNFAIQKTADIQNQYYVVNNARHSAARLSPTVSYDVLSATKKLVKIENMTNPANIIMSESFNPNWGIVVGADGKLLNRNYINESNHFIANGWQNGWYIDPAGICKDSSNSCIKNADGSYNLTLSVEFRPQKYVLIGSLLAAVSFIVLIIYLGLYSRRTIK